MKPKVRQLTDSEREILADTFDGTFHDYVFQDPQSARILHETLLEGGRIWVEVKAPDMESPQNEAPKDPSYYEDNYGILPG